MGTVIRKFLIWATTIITTWAEHKSNNWLLSTMRNVTTCVYGQKE